MAVPVSTVGYAAKVIREHEAHLKWLQEQRAIADACGSFQFICQAGIEVSE